VICIKKLLATILITSTLITPCLALTATECQQIQQTAHTMAECARQLGYAEDSVIIQEAQKKWWEAQNSVWRGPVLTARAGTIQGPSGKETYYNLPMHGVVNRMRRLGYDAENWPYWVRSDGAKMLGNYILCAASLDIRPIGTILDTSRGKAIVADTGSFARSNPTQIDLAMQW
jgi:hypothetical protein